MAKLHQAFDAEPATSREQDVGISSPLEDLNTLQREIRDLIHDQLRLTALEARLAAQSLMSMIAAAVCVGVLLLLAWVGLMGVIGLGLVGIGLKPAFVLLVVVALTIGLAVVLGVFIRHRSRRMGFPATLRALKPTAKDTHFREKT